MRRRLRDESTPEGRQIWADVDKAAGRAPRWIHGAMLRAAALEVLNASEYHEGLSDDLRIALLRLASSCGRSSERA